MAQKTIPKTVTEKARQFALHTKRHGIPVSGVYIFGSYAKGTRRRWSDIDVCIISPQFTDQFDALQKLWNLRSDRFIPIEPIGMTEEDLNDRYSTLAAEIRRHGVNVPI